MTLFTIENREFGWDEIVVAAQVWGEWQVLFESVRHSLACLRLAAQIGQLPSTVETREAAKAFRYERNLISGDETQIWLQRWEMSVEEWMQCLRGLLLRTRWASRVNEIKAANPIPDADVAKVIKKYAVCTGKVDDWVYKLAGRAALAAKSSGLISAALSPRDVIDRIEREFERQRNQTISAKLIETKIFDRRLDWIHYECRYLWLADERVAREAAWCVSEDGLTLDEAAKAAHGEVRQWNFYADEIEPSVRPYFVAARKGDLLGPLRFASGYPLFSVLQKRMPAASDPEILSRAEEAIVANLTAQAINERVRWVEFGVRPQ
jgi:hypothetical protein